MLARVTVALDLTLNEKPIVLVRSTSRRTSRPDVVCRMWNFVHSFVKSNAEESFTSIYTTQDDIFLHGEESFLVTSLQVGQEDFSLMAIGYGALASRRTTAGRRFLRPLAR